MCPAANGDASGGTPAASAASGGHIKKGAWVSAHEAALDGIAGWFGNGPVCSDVLTAKDRSAAHLVEQKADQRPESEQGPEEDGGHSGRLGLEQWEGRIQLAHGVDPRVGGVTAANLPERGEGHAAFARQDLHLRVAQGFETSTNFSGSGNVWLHKTPRISDPV